MGVLGHRAGSALHRGWRQPRQPVHTTNSSQDYTTTKKLKEESKTMKEMEEILKKEMLERRAKAGAAKKAKRELREQNIEKNEEKGRKTIVSDKKIRKLTKKQLRKLGIRKI